MGCFSNPAGELLRLTGRWTYYRAHLSPVCSLCASAVQERAHIPCSHDSGQRPTTRALTEHTHDSGKGSLDTEDGLERVKNLYSRSFCFTGEEKQEMTNSSVVSIAGIDGDRAVNETPRDLDHEECQRLSPYQPWSGSSHPLSS